MYVNGDIADAHPEAPLVVLPTELVGKSLGDANAKYPWGLLSYLGMLILPIFSPISVYSECRWPQAFGSTRVEAVHFLLQSIVGINRH